jgi:putrescine aminotransferase
MANKNLTMNQDSNLILHRTSAAELQEGVTIISKAKGTRVFDKAGKSYLDMTSGITRPMHLGHGREDMAKAVYDQICTMDYFTPSQYANEPAIQLAEDLDKVTPKNINRFLFECDGSEAVESAMKLAKEYHNQNGKKAAYKVLSRRGAYHGVNGIGIRALGTVMPMRHNVEPVAPGGVFVESPYCYRCPFGLQYPSCDMRCARDVERIVEFENPELISTFMCEPVQQGFGAYTPPPEYFPIIREICDNYDILLVIDEVICGFGRTGKLFGVEHLGIRPDMMTMAKGLTSGYVPAGAVGCNEKIVNSINMFTHLHTYGNHPVSCAAGIKSLQIIQEEKLVEKSESMGDYFLNEMKAMEKHAIVGEVRGRGLWTAIDFTVDKKTRAPFPLSSLGNMVAMAKENGFMFKMMGQALEFAPPLIIEKSEIDEAMKMIDQVITAEVKNLGL